MTARERINNVAALFYLQTLVVAVVGYFSVSSLTLLGTFFVLALGTVMNFFVHYALLGGSRVLRKVILVFNVLVFLVAPFLALGLVKAFPFAPLRALVAVVSLAWHLFLNLASFRVLRRADVKRILFA